MCSKLDFYSTLEVCSYLSLDDLYNILISDVGVFDKFAVSDVMNKTKNNMSNYHKLLFFYKNPEVAVKLFNLRSLCNQIFRCIKRSEFSDYIICKFFYYIMDEEYVFPFVPECYHLLSRIIRRFPGLVLYIDDKVFGNKYFIRDFKIWKCNDEYIYNKINNYIKDKHTDLYEKYYSSKWIMRSDDENDTDDEYDTDEFGDSDDEVEYEDV